MPIALRNGTICLPLVTELSRLGLKASPEKKVRRETWPLYRACDLYSLTTDWKRAIPPAGSAEPDLRSPRLVLNKFGENLDDFTRCGIHH